MKTERQTNPLKKQPWTYPVQKIRDDFTYLYQKAPGAVKSRAFGGDRTANGACWYQNPWYRKKKSADGICRLCGPETETADYMICECPALAGLRTINMGKLVLGTQEVMAKVPEENVGLINAIDYLLGFHV